MPEMEGTEFILNLSAELLMTNIIVMSGDGSIAGVDFLELARNLGAHKVFKKTFTYEELLAAVNELLL